jgi:hypothetical protein
MAPGDAEGSGRAGNMVVAAHRLRSRRAGGVHCRLGRLLTAAGRPLRYPDADQRPGRARRPVPMDHDRWLRGAWRLLGGVRVGAPGGARRPRERGTGSRADSGGRGADRRRRAAAARPDAAGWLGRRVVAQPRPRRAQHPDLRRADRGPAAAGPPAAPRTAAALAARAGGGVGAGLGGGAGRLRLARAAPLGRRAAASGRVPAAGRGGRGGAPAMVAAWPLASRSCRSRGGR